MHVRFFTPFLTSSPIQFSGMPQRPKPPTRRVIPSFTSFSASSTLLTTLLIIDCVFLFADKYIDFILFIGKQALKLVCSQRYKARLVIVLNKIIEPIKR